MLQFSNCAQPDSVTSTVFFPETLGETVIGAVTLRKASADYSS
jgi:hypothetical protein